MNATDKHGNPSDRSAPAEVICPDCNGTGAHTGAIGFGETWTDECTSCNGWGRVLGPKLPLASSTGVPTTGDWIGDAQRAYEEHEVYTEPTNSEGLAYEITQEMLADLLAAVGVTAASHDLLIKKTAGAIVGKVTSRLSTVPAEGDDRG